MPSSEPRRLARLLSLPKVRSVRVVVCRGPKPKGDGHDDCESLFYIRSHQCCTLEMQAKDCGKQNIVRFLRPMMMVTLD